MTWIDAYSQGSFSLDEDPEAYGLRVGLYALIPLLLPLLLLLSCVIKVPLQKSWLLSFALLLPISGAAWSVAVAASAKPLETSNNQLNVIKQWSQEALDNATLITNIIDNVVQDASQISCDGYTIPNLNTSKFVTDAQTLYNEVESIYTDINDIDIENSMEETITLSLAIGIGVLVLFPILVYFVLLIMKRSKYIFPFVVFAAVLLAILNAVFLPALIAQSDGCKHFDVVIKRLSDQDERVVFYIDCTGKSIYPTLQNELDTAKLEVGEVLLEIEIIKAFKGLGCTNLGIDAIESEVLQIQSLINNLPNIVQCSTVNTLYEESKHTVCGNDVYGVTLYMHQSLFMTYASLLLFWFAVLVVKDNTNSYTPLSGPFY